MLSFALAATSVKAEQIEGEGEQSEAAQAQVELGEIEIWATPFAQSTGTQIIDRFKIDNMPVGNGSISELLRNNPNVQYSSRSNSQSQGEIAPENVSFHGERFYNNNWLIDGLSNNDNINPGSNAGSITAIDGQQPFNLPDGGTQSFWINTDLVESVAVFDSNISAEYGQFTGGVIDANLVEPDIYQAWGSISYRTTRDSWTDFHFDSDEEQSDFEQATILYNQPRFTKNIYALNVNQPLNEQAALLFSYNRTESDIPFFHSFWQVWEDQQRLAETYLLKGLYETDNGDRWQANLIYSPHQSSYIFPNTRNGNYDLDGGGYRADIEWETLFEHFSLESVLAYKYTENQIHYRANDYFSWVYDADFFDFQSSSTTAQEGGFGETITEKGTVTLKQKYQFNPQTWGETAHKVTAGWQADFAEARYQRKNQTNIYTATGLVTPSLCYRGDQTCIAGSQAADIWLQYLASTVEVSNDHFSAYLQDQIQWQQFEFTFGLRLDYDEFLKNLDGAPRFTVSYDLFENQQTLVFGGVNRYYADSLLAYALSEQKGNALRYRRDVYANGFVLDAESTIGGTFINPSLNTPYSDELNLGIKHNFAFSEWTLKWVKRQGKDQFVRQTTRDDNNRNIFTLTNSGESDADSFTLQGNLLEPIAWRGIELYASFGANYLKNNSTFTSYDPGHLFNDQTFVVAGGQVLPIDEVLSRNSFNQPWTMFTNLELSFPAYGLSWAQDYRLTGAYRNWQVTDETLTCGLNTPQCNGQQGTFAVYQEVDYSARFVADWHLGYQFSLGALAGGAPAAAEQQAEISIDILNVFNAKVEGEATNIGSSGVSYQPGRRFWLNAKYRW